MSATASALVRPRLDCGVIGAALALAAVAALAWANVVGDARSMDDGTADFGLGVPAAFVVAWTVMMAAMMLPSAAPLVLVYRRASRARLATPLLAAGYLAVWAAFGVLAYAVDRAAMELPMRPLAAGVLVAAGLYQVTPLKDVCLRTCRSPVGFLLGRWRAGRFGALRLGLEHGAYCLGCCWALMLVLLAAGGMGLAWVAGLALVILAEKVLPGGERTARGVALALVALGIAAAAIPGFAESLRV